MMKQMFRMMMVPCVAAVAAVTAFAAPNPKWVPANADFVMTADGLDTQNAEAEKVWSEGLEKIGIPTGSPKETIAQLDEACPGLSIILKELFGANEDFSKIALKSVTCALYVDKEDVKADGFKHSYITLVLENPKADLTKLEAAIKQVLANPKNDKIELTREKAWLTFRGKDRDDKGDGIAAICQIPDGYLVTLQASLERAEAVRKGEVKPIAAGNPLMVAFTPKAEGVDQIQICALKDLSELLTRFMDADQLAQATMAYPPAAKTKRIATTTVTRGTTTDFTITIDTTDEAAAQQTVEAVLGYKMLAQMLGPSMMGKPDSKLLAFIAGISCKAEGKSAVISCTFTPETILPIWAEIQELQKQAAANFANYADDDDDDVTIDMDDLLEEDEDDEEPLSPEEAKAILDALDLE